MKKELQSLLEAVDKREDELIELLKYLVQFKTPAPPARNTEEAQAFIGDFLATKKFHIDTWEVYPGTLMWWEC